MEIVALYEDSLLGLRKPQQFEKVAIFLLDSLKAIDANSAKSTKDVYSAYEKLRAKDPKVVYFSESSVAVYLSKLADDENSMIFCEGKKQGYYVRSQEDLKTIAEKQEQDQTEVLSKEQLEEKRLEKELYPLFLDWLGYDCDIILDISTKRKMGVWGNPDLLGIRLCTIVGTTNVEITTIEVKRSIAKWRYDIFEAVSHSMFANRVYFAFRCKYDEFCKVKQEMLLYADKYKIGLLANFVDVDSNIVQEIAPAPVTYPNMFMQQKFLHSLNLINVEDLYKIDKNKENNQ